MSDKATDKANASSSSDSDGARAQDLEHSPQAAHKASRAGLKRAESADQLTSATDGDRKEQRDNSKQSNIEGFEGAILVAAKQVVDHCTRIDTLVRAPKTEAGNEPLRQAIAACASTIEDRVNELYMNVSGAVAGGMEAEPLRLAMATFARACTEFQNTATGAGHEVAGPNGGLTRATELRMTGLFKLVGVQSGGASTPDPVVTSQMTMLRHSKSADMNGSAFGVMLGATKDGVRLARMSVVGVQNDTRLRDLRRANANVRELAALVETVDDKTKRQHHAELRAVAGDARIMLAEERAKPLELDRDATRAAAQKAELEPMVASGSMTESSIAKIEQATR